MKKLIYIISIITFLITISVTAFAGDVPESLLSEDDAKVFVGTVDDYTIETKSLYSSVVSVKTADITPTVALKGDVRLGVTQTYEHCDFGYLIPQKDTEYLFGYIDENNFSVYEIESRDENIIKLVDSDKYNMVKRLENYLNEGAFAMAEQERLSIGKQISFLEFLYKRPSLSSSAVEKVILRYQNEFFEIDKDKFFETAENIMITGVKNETLSTQQPDNTILYIELLGANNELVYHGAVSSLGEVDRYGLFMSRLMMKDYEMKAEDLSKLYSLLPEDVQDSIAESENLTASDENFPSQAQKKNYAGLIVCGIIIAFIIVIIIGYKVIKKTN